MKLRLAELPALFWVTLAGREARERLRFILASRGHARHERFRRLAAAADQMERDLTAEFGAFGTLRELRRTRKASEAADAGSEVVAGLMAALRLVRLTPVCGKPGHDVVWTQGDGQVCLTCQPGKIRRWEWCCQSCGAGGWEERRGDNAAHEAAVIAADVHACPDDVKRVAIFPPWAVARNLT